MEEVIEVAQSGRLASRQSGAGVARRVMRLDSGRMAVARFVCWPGQAQARGMVIARQQAAKLGLRAC